MGVFGQHGRRGRRSSKRFLGHLSDSGWGAAEGVLGLVAMVLIVWILWPEDQGPQLDQRAAWERTVRDGERLSADAEATGALDEAETADAARQETEAETTKAESLTGRVDVPAEPRRRRIASPAEFGDRLDSFGRRQGTLAANDTFTPGPRRPRSETDPSVPDEKKTPPETVQAALSEMVTNLQADRLLLDEQAEPSDSVEPTAEGDASPVTDPLENPPLEVAVLSSEALDAEPLPEVDLSDLDSLVPLTDKPSSEPDLQGSDASGLEEPTQQAAIEPFVVVEDEPAADVRHRPRDDAPTWLKNAVTASPADDRPIIAVVIDDLGLNRPNTAALNKLPAPLTLAFLPYAGKIEAQTEAAQAAGHELMLHLPMEPLGADWPGPDALTTKIDQDEFEARLQKNLGRFDGFVGVNNHMGSKLTGDSSRMGVVMRELRKRDVLFLDSKTSARSVASEVAGQNGVPNTTRDVFLDHVIDLGTVRRQLARVEQIARQGGSAIAIGHPHGVTIEALREWLPNLEARGFALAPISAVVARRACSKGVLIATDTCGRFLNARTPAGSALAAKDG